MDVVLPVWSATTLMMEKSANYSTSSARQLAVFWQRHTNVKYIWTYVRIADCLISLKLACQHELQYETRP